MTGLSVRSSDLFTGRDKEETRLGPRIEDMLMIGIDTFLTALLIFALGALSGARMVYWCRHVTTKSIHRSLLNSLQLQRQMRDPNLDSFAENETDFIVLEDD